MTKGADLSEAKAPGPRPLQTEHPRGDLLWLVAIMKRLLAPGGCPWDREQTLESLKPFLIEECYELIDAIDSEDEAAHREELGDVLLQIVFQAELAGHSMAEVVSVIGDKLLHRHPHVFGDTSVESAEEVLVNWEAIKAKEKASSRTSMLDGVPRGLPALHRSHELTRKAAKAGFRWRSAGKAREKVGEELGEVDAALHNGELEEARREIGDLLFSIAAWAREVGVQPEDALRLANERFEARFRHLEATMEGEGRSMRDADEEELLGRWLQAKAATAR